MLRHLSYGLIVTGFFAIPCFIAFVLQVVSLFHTVLWHLSNRLSVSEFSDLYGYYGRCMRVSTIFYGLIAPTWVRWGLVGFVPHPKTV